MYGLEELDEEYCVHLPDGALLRVPITDDGELAEVMTRYEDNRSEREVTKRGLSADLRSFITARTGRDFE